MRTQKFLDCLYSTPISCTDAEKLAYLCHGLMNGSAKSVVEGLSRSGDYYDEAITCLNTRYDRPRSILQAHYQ